MDEDGQHDPAFIGALLDTAMARAGHASSTPDPTNRPPHGFCATSPRAGRSGWSTALTGAPTPAVFHSYRLVLGEVGRSVAAYAGAGVYLDVALGWVVGRVTTARSSCAHEGDRAVGLPHAHAALALLAHGAHQRHPRAAAVRQPRSA